MSSALADLASRPYFTGAGDPYEKLERALRAEIDEAALYRTVSRPLDVPESGRIEVKVINHYGGEAEGPGGGVSWSDRVGRGPFAALRVTRIASFALVTAMTTGEAASQSQASPPATFRYTPAQLACATFQEQSRATLDAQTGNRQRRETLLRGGLLRLRARSVGTGIALEAWYDSLALSRESPETTLEPDTDGLLGGRYRGRLTPAGHYRAEARPFVPDEVAEVAELGGALDDLLPPLPPVALAVGQRWTDGHGLQLRRLPDSVAGRQVVQRLGLRARTESDRATVRGDTTTLAARQVTVEEGQIDWDADRGLLRRMRRLVVETAVPAGGPLKLPLRSRLEQEGSLVRMEMGPASHPERSEGSGDACE